MTPTLVFVMSTGIVLSVGCLVSLRIGIIGVLAVGLSVVIIDIITILHDNTLER